MHGIILHFFTFFSLRIPSYDKTGALSHVLSIIASPLRSGIRAALASLHGKKKKKKKRKGNTNRFAQVRNGRTRFLPAAERHFWRHSTRFRAGILVIADSARAPRGFAKMRGEKGEKIRKKRRRGKREGRRAHACFLCKLRRRVKVCLQSARARCRTALEMDKDLEDRSALAPSLSWEIYRPITSVQPFPVLFFTSQSRNLEGTSSKRIFRRRHVPPTRSRIAREHRVRQFCYLPRQPGNVGKLGMSHARSRGRFRAGQRGRNRYFRELYKWHRFANNSRRGLTSSVTAHDGGSLRDRTMRETLWGTRIPAMPAPSRSALRKHQQNVKDYVAPRKPAETKSTVK